MTLSAPDAGRTAWLSWTPLANIGLGVVIMVLYLILMFSLFYRMLYFELPEVEWKGVVHKNHK